MEQVLQTKRLRLAPLTADDLDHLVALDGDGAVRRMVDPLGINIPSDPDERRTYESERFVRRSRFYGARERVGGALIGWFQLEPVPDRPDEVDLGYRLARVNWGLGYATEGARALVAYAFDVLGYPRVFAHTLHENAASMRVLERCGLRVVAPWELPRTSRRGRCDRRDQTRRAGARSRGPAGSRQGPETPG